MVAPRNGTLTMRQAELLDHCVRSGSYSIPRRATLRRLAAELGISTTSLSLALRRAEAKIILAYVARQHSLAAEAEAPTPRKVSAFASPAAVVSTATGRPHPR